MNATQKEKDSAVYLVPGQGKGGRELLNFQLDQVGEAASTNWFILFYLQTITVLEDPRIPQ